MSMQGIWTALWTPTNEKGTLLKDALKKHLDFLIERGVRGVVVSGTTGQFPYFSLDSRLEQLDVVMQHIGGERVLVNISDASPFVVKKYAHAVSTRPVKAIMLMPPSYYAFPQADIAYYIRHMAQIANHPLILYNLPDCTRNRIDAETLDSLSKPGALPVPLLGIKQSGADFAYHKPYIDVANKNGFIVFTGSDSKFSEALAMGAKANIGGMSNGVPELMCAVLHAHQNGTPDTAMEKIRVVDQHLKTLLFPLNIAALMEARGLTPGAIKEIVAPETIKKYHQLVADLKQILA